MWRCQIGDATGDDTATHMDLLKQSVSISINKRVSMGPQ